jgi:hypothetical protein
LGEVRGEPRADSLRVKTAGKCKASAMSCGERRGEGVVRRRRKG